MRKPSLFIGSSTEGLEVARAAGYQLRDTAEVTIWNEGVFGLSQSALEALVNSLERFDFALLVATPDDLVTRRDEAALGPRDNILFELGLFMGRLGRARTYLLCDPHTVRLPSDLAGVTVATYDSQRTDQNLIAALSPAAVMIRTVMRDLGPFVERGVEQLEQATNEVRGASSAMERVIHLLARSRVAELEVVSQQFGPLIQQESLRKILQDLRDLQQSTEPHPKR